MDLITFKYYNRTFKQIILLSTEGNFDLFNKYCKEYYDFTLANMNVATGSAAITIETYESPNAVAHIFFPEYRKREKDRTYLMHECLHASHSLCDYLGIPTDTKKDKNNDEIVAYLQGEMFNYFNKKLLNYYKNKAKIK